MTTLRLAPERTLDELDWTLVRAADRLLELQHPDGYWVGELESNATMIAQHLFWHHALRLRTPDRRRPARDRRPAGGDAPAAPAERGPPPGDPRGRALGARAPGGGRLLGGHPAALGVVDRDARRPRPRPRRPDARRRGRGLG